MGRHKSPDKKRELEERYRILEVEVAMRLYQFSRRNRESLVAVQTRIGNHAIELAKAEKTGLPAGHAWLIDD